VGEEARLAPSPLAADVWKMSISVREIFPPDAPEAEALAEACRRVFDPELPVDVWALGLIRSIEVEPFGRVVVEMALTSPGCPSAQALPDAVRRACEAVVGDGRVSVLVRLDPPWDASWVEADARLALGLP
jgi:metal-sulfur cluster biosynthetic enzyme